MVGKYPAQISSPFRADLQTWPGDTDPAPATAYFWISAFNSQGQNAWNIDVNGKLHKVDNSAQAESTAQPVPLASGRLSVTIDYADLLSGRPDNSQQVRLLITSGNLRDLNVVGSKGQIYVSRNIVIQGTSPDKEGVNPSLTTSAASLLPVQTDENGAKFQPMKGADQHVTGTVDAKRVGGAQRNGAAAGAAALVVGVVAAAALVI